MAEAVEDEAIPLSLLFRRAQAAYTEVDESTLSGSDPKLQRRVAEGLAMDPRRVDAHPAKTAWSGGGTGAVLHSLSGVRPALKQRQLKETPASPSKVTAGLLEDMEPPPPLEEDAPPALTADA